MGIADIVEVKGNVVTTIDGAATVADAIAEPDAPVARTGPGRAGAGP